MLNFKHTFDTVIEKANLAYCADFGWSGGDTEYWSNTYTGSNIGG